MPPAFPGLSDEFKLLLAQTGECRLRVDLRFVAKTLARLHKFFQSRGLAPSVWSELELAAAEAFNNAIQHRSSKRMSAEVVCRWNWTAETIEIEIWDTGSYLPPSGKARLPEDPLAESGRGALLIERLVDLVEHTVSAEGHSIRLTKRVGEMHKRQAASASRIDNSNAGAHLEKEFSK